jgi:hypothetical protein
VDDVARAEAAGDSSLGAWEESDVLDELLPYGDEKVANRDIRVWHGATEKGS